MNNPSSQELPITPWYKQFWPWFLIVLPLSVVIASFVTLYIFNQNQISLVSDDYYKEGKGINQDLTKYQKATELGIYADLSIIQTDDGDELVIHLNKGKMSQYLPIKLNLRHRTIEKNDIYQMLTADAKGNYRLNLNNKLQGPWTILVTSFDDTWKISGKASFPSTSKINLQGKEAI